MKATEAFRKTIKDYLEKRGSKDPLFARMVMKTNKNIDDCIAYVLNTVQKSGCNGFTDDEVYSMAIHYFSEDNINIGGNVNYNVVVNHKVELTEEEKKEAREKAMEELKNEIKAKARRKSSATDTNIQSTAEQRANEHSGSKSAEQTLF